MSYFMRAFCTAPVPRSLGAACAWANMRGVRLALASNGGRGGRNAQVDMESSEWAQAELAYASGQPPLVVVCNRRRNSADSSFDQEIRSVQTLLSPPGLSLGKWLKLRHLANSQFVVACQVPSNNPQARKAAELFLRYFISQCNGMVYVDREGFKTEKNLAAAS